MSKCKAKDAEALFALPCIFCVDGLGAWAGERFGCFVGNGARY